MSVRTKRLAAAVGALTLLALDRIAKWYAVTALSPEGVALIPGLRFVYWKNPGLIGSLSVPVVAITVSVLAFLTLLGVVALAVYRRRTHLKEPRSLLAGSLIALGGISNIMDRIFFGGVTDYFLFFNRSAINLADGMILAGILIFFSTKKTETVGG